MNKDLIEKKELSFVSRQEAAGQAEDFLSELDIGCEPSTPQIIALDGNDLNRIQEQIMQDEEYRDILKAKNLGDMSFDEGMEIYFLEYSFTLDDIHVFGKDDPAIQSSGEDPLAAQNMGATFIISRSGMERVFLEGLVAPLPERSDKIDMIDYNGIKEALEKKFGDVILTEEYRITNIWLEYFPLIRKDSFYEVDIVPVWCCDFEIDGESDAYTLRFHGLTGEEIR